MCRYQQSSSQACRYPYIYSSPPHLLLGNQHDSCSLYTLHRIQAAPHDRNPTEDPGYATNINRSVNIMKSVL